MKHKVSGDCYIWEEYMKDPITGLPLYRWTGKLKCNGEHYEISSTGE